VLCLTTGHVPTALLPNAGNTRQNVERRPTSKNEMAFRHVVVRRALLPPTRAVEMVTRKWARDD
jgi:hypothetical protein